MNSPQHALQEISVRTALCKQGLQGACWAKTPHRSIAPGSLTRQSAALILHLAVSEHAQQHFAVTLKCLLGSCSLQSRSWWALMG